MKSSSSCLHLDCVEAFVNYESLQFIHFNTKSQYIAFHSNLASLNVLKIIWILIKLFLRLLLLLLMLLRAIFHVQNINISLQEKTTHIQLKRLIYHFNVQRIH